MKPSTLLTLAAAFAVLLTHCETTGVGGGGPLPEATKDKPFVNSLGMKFVPVPWTKILMCITETTVAQYQAAGLGYQAPDFSQGSNHPAVNVSWNDAKAWCKWMSGKDGHKYRLPTEAEWTAAVGPSTYPWGNQWPPPNNAGNYMGQEWRGSEGMAYAKKYGAKESNAWQLIGGFSDRHTFTAPVGSYAANGLGIYDLGGNVSEWCENCVVRGVGWYHFTLPGEHASSYGLDITPGNREFDCGFRCVVVR